MHSAVVREVGLALVTAGVVVLLFVVFELLGTNLSEEHSQARLAREFSSEVSLASPAKHPAISRAKPHAKGFVAKGAAATGGTKRVVDAVALPVPPLGGAIAHIVIPAIGVNRYVVQGVAANDLQMGPGHYLGTPLPGQPGNVGIAGHRTTFGAPFFSLNQLTAGDLVYLTDTSGTTWVYSVQRKWVVSPSDVAVLNPTRGAELTLTTCNPRFEAVTRLVVRARLVEGLARGTMLAGHLPVTLAMSQARALHGPPARAATPAPSPARMAMPAGHPAAGHPAAGHPAAGHPAAGHSPTVGPRTGAVFQPGNPGAWTWVEMGAWGLLALAAWVVTRLLAAARRYRYTKFLVLAGGALVCLVPLWFAFENVVNLLPPNL